MSIIVKDNIDFLVISGPTAVGKTDLSINLAQKYNGEIINGDSIQVYKGLDIGSAKITKDEQAGIKHHLLDIKNADEQYTVADFQNDALTLIESIRKKGKLPIIVGGTGLYLNAIIYDYQQLVEIDENDSVYKNLIKQTNNEIYEIIKEAAIKVNLEIHPNNRKRNINYAYKVLKGLPLVEEVKQKNCQIICLTMDRAELKERIDLRVDLMIKNGLIEEVKEFKRDWPSQQGIGYKEIHRYLNKEISKDFAIAEIKKNTRKLAKKQLTWFRNKVNADWYIRKGEQWELHQN